VCFGLDASARRDPKGTDHGDLPHGTVGPPAFIPAFSALWLGFVSVFFIGGSIGFLTDALTGHGFGLLPFVLIPALMLGMFIVITEMGARISAKEWERMEQWLRLLLDGPEEPRS
jgi:hypothetical protein